MPQTFTLEESRDGEVLIIRCIGELDIATTPTVEEAIGRLVAEERPRAIHLDWSAVTFMDSTGIRLLLGALILCRDHNIELTWRLSRIARKALDLVGIHDALLRDFTSKRDE